MSLNQSAEFEMVILYAQAPGIERTFSFMEKLAAFTHERFEKLVFIPRDIILFAVAVQWNLSPSLTTMARRLLGSHDEPFIPAWEPQFPSRGNDVSHGPFRTVQTSFTFRFPTTNTLHEFFRDLHTYVFRPFSRQPKCGRMDISIFVEVPTQAHKILIVADLAHVDSDWLENGLVGITGQPWEEQILRLFLTISDHFEDLRTLKIDLEYAHAELTKLGPQIERARRITREQLELAQVRRTTVLTILAGLYIPLSFVSSFFGMNVSQFTASTTESERNITNMDPLNRNITEPGPHQIITKTGENQSFDVRYYWAVAVPLTFFTILFPLIAGAVTRWCLQIVSRGGTWWRVLVALFSLL
ncbi:hypothetical protein SLS58_009019 [Diplodia intermedia]|uniref:Uncharacterized protein n=1 Tax=Diplodia intermedia TaxID=856260 RepID=A0ABR3TEY0_9PEZI